MRTGKKLPMLCLDLEGTLISNAISQIPRPGLFSFLERVVQICDLSLYTSVSAERVDSIRRLLIAENAAPDWLLFLPVIRPEGSIKFKALAGRVDALLLDDQPSVLAPGEESWWVPIKEFAPPYSDDDRELDVALALVESRLAFRGQPS
ncbi:MULTISPECIES: NIF family HAD-type phosphatase [Marinobacter]|uniref:NIF family HAD-type phosphatase n=1 Tax=Marinobacter TaxID=2742 RepID=UPI001B137433|nr:NIF family HAD-type phosphatase [Marinobacter sp.]MBO6812120.1 hypothetical protein [Marinobacter sp.]MBO6873632.1 hypothetical protein [Marinobacter sp.]